MEHINSPCEKASKYKWEKWQILHDSFTPLFLKVPSDFQLDHHDSADRLNSPLTTEVADTPEPGAIGGVTADGNAMGTLTAETNPIGIDVYERLQKEHEEFRQRQSDLRTQTRAWLDAAPRIDIIRRLDNMVEKHPPHGFTRTQ